VDPIAWFGQRLFPLVVDASESPNPVYSPASIFFALAMTGEGARGQTERQFAEVLGIDRAAANARAAELIAAWSGYNGAQGNASGQAPLLTVADSLWFDPNDFAVEPAFEANARENYAAQVKNVSFADPATVGEINQWISDHTNKLIPKLVDQLDPDTVIALVNALYLKASWAEPFSQALTAKGDFTLASGEVVQADMMHGQIKSQDQAAYIQSPDGSLGAVLPYAASSLAMVAVMPAGGIDSLEWDGAQLQAWLAQRVPSSQLTVALPKWEADSGPVDLIPVLRTLGLVDPFDPKIADLSGIGPGGVCVSDALHQAVVKVDEAGTEAAAATVVGGETTSYVAPTNPFTVEFNRPFVYVIVDLETAVPLFFGAVTDPTS
jgi:serpin B